MSGIQDPDGDSQMQSSPSSQASSDEMFPSASTPQPSTAQPNPLNPAELSPPNSQSRAQAPGSMDELMNDSIEPPKHAMTQESFNSDFNPADERMAKKGSAENLGMETELDDKKPGWIWKNTKAADDKQRSIDVCLDRGFSLKEFGDPYYESSMNGK